MHVLTEMERQEMQSQIRKLIADTKTIVDIQVVDTKTIFQLQVVINCVTYSIIQVT